MKSPVLVVDTWKEGGDIDEALLLRNGVVGIFLRINDMSGGHHVDENFAPQWKQASNMIRIPYFVFNPWVDGKTNYDWLIAHLPPECGSCAVDVEVKYSGITPSKYYVEVLEFWNFLTKTHNAIVYSGAGYLDLLSQWMKDVDYWWAQYPDAFYKGRKMTWMELKKELENYDLPFNSTKVPGQLKMWQFTGDKIVMEGCQKPMDVSVWYGTEEELRIFANNKETPGDPLQQGLPKLLSEREYFDGALYKQFEVYFPHQGLTTYHVFEIERLQSEIFVGPYTGNNYVPVMMQKAAMDIGINGVGWSTDVVKHITSINGYIVSKGRPQGTKGMKGNVYITQKGFSLNPDPTAQMVLSFENILVQNGSIPVINKADDYRARTAFGWLKDQSKFYIVVVDGMDYQMEVGMSFKETAQIFVDLGCDFACMFDGGGSTTLSVMDNGKPTLLNKTYGEEDIPGYQYPMRPVAELIGVKMLTDPKEPPVIVTPEGEEKMWTVDKDIQLRPTASYYNSGGKMIFKGYTFDSTKIVDGLPNKAGNADVGVQFVELPTGGFLPIAYKGITYLVKSNVQVPPVVAPTTGPRKVTVVDDSGTYECTTFTKVS